MADPTVVFTDGACAGNPGPGGWAWAVSPDGDRFANGGATHTTNQRMEVRAVLEALRVIDGPVQIVSDSTYVVNCFRDRWWEGWIRRGWKNSQKQPVANRDLWEPLIELVRARGDVTFRWVKGHSRDPMNDLVDQLAVAACAAVDRSPADRSRDAAPRDAASRDAASQDAPSLAEREPTGSRRPDAAGGPLSLF